MEGREEGSGSDSAGRAEIACSHSRNKLHQIELILHLHFHYRRSPQLQTFSVTACKDDSLSRRTRWQDVLVYDGAATGQALRGLLTSPRIRGLGFARFVESSRGRDHAVRTGLTRAFRRGGRSTKPKILPVGFFNHWSKIRVGIVLTISLTRTPVPDVMVAKGPCWLP